MTNVIFPELGEGISRATVACWHKSVGDRVEIDDDLLELVTDKATFNVPTQVSGVIRKICVLEGAQANLGEVLAVIEEKE